MSLSKEQLEAVELFAQGNTECRFVAEAVGVCAQTVSNWRKTTEFTDACVLRARELLKHSLPDIYSVLIREAKNGKIHHIRTVLEHLDNLEKFHSLAKRGDVSFSFNIPEAT